MAWSTSFYHYDALGSARQLTDAAEATTDSYEYDAWGSAVSSSGTTQNTFRWNGRSGYYWDSDSSTHYVRARHYAPSLGRWLSRDPIDAQSNASSGHVPVIDIMDLSELSHISYAATRSGKCWDLLRKTSIRFQQLQMKLQCISPINTFVRLSVHTSTAHMYVDNQPMNLVDPAGLETYDAAKGALFQGLTNYTQLEPGDKIINTSVGTITVLSKNLQEFRNSDYKKAKCVLTKLGFVLPEPSNNGVYWARFDRRLNDGYTVFWSGLGGSAINFSFVNAQLYKNASKKCDRNFLEFIVTLYHEVKGHNWEDIEGHPPIFIERFEKPIYDAYKKAVAEKEWRCICKKCSVGSEP